MKTKEELKKYFENGDTPKQEEFWDWQESYWHKNEKLDKTLLDLPAYEEFVYSLTDNTEVIGLGKRITFPEGIKVIGASGFSFSAPGKNYISQVIFPNTLERIKFNAFISQYLTGILRIPGSCKVIEASAFISGNSRVSELILEDGIETIDNYAFQLTGSTTITDLHIPKSVKSVGQNTFNIPSLQTVSAPTGLDLSNAGIPSTATITYR